MSGRNSKTISHHFCSQINSKRCLDSARHDKFHALRQIGLGGSAAPSGDAHKSRLRRHSLTSSKGLLDSPQQAAMIISLPALSSVDREPVSTHCSDRVARWKG